jgi:hypothetical protein
MDYSYFYKMKKIILLFISTLLFSGCSQKVDISKLNAINGYWQINKAVNSDGDKKEYPINEVYDYYSIKDKVGFHKKVTWQPDGTFLVNDLQDKVKINIEKEKVSIDFSSQYGKHTEELESISNEEMILVGKDETKFYYKKVDLKTD